MANDSSQELAARLEQCYSGAVYDVLRTMDYPNQILPQSIRPLQVEATLAGPVFTVAGHCQPNLDGHQTLVAWTAMLSKAPSGYVVVCQPNDSTLAHMGELSSETLQFRGVRGYIVDGGCRDSAFIHRIGFGVFCGYYTPADVVGRWIVKEFGKPVVIGGVHIDTGDFVMADRDGVVVIPKSMVQEVVERTEQVLRTENLVRKAILQGEDPQQAYLAYGKF